MTHVSDSTGHDVTSDAQAFTQAIHEQVHGLAYLPGSTAVAIKFIEIGKDPDAGPAEYDKIVSADASLSTKILCLANSSWFATRNKVSTVLQAINMLGINNIRTLAISYCMAGMYNKLKVPKEDLDLYWQASLCKGISAKVFVRELDASLEDEAFMACLFQDMALPVMHAAAGDVLTAVLADRQYNVAAQVANERALLGMCHTEVGRMLATKLELPQMYVDAIAHHHEPDVLSTIENLNGISGAIQSAAMFPHLPNQWHASDVDAMAEYLSASVGGPGMDRETYLGKVQEEFDSLYRFFQPEGSPQLRLSELISDACEELADATSTMMGQMQTLMHEAAQMGAAVNELAKRHEELEDERHRDPLTGVYNRAGFFHKAQQCIQDAVKDSSPYAILYLDIDKFKTTNDTKGHQFGDYVLCEITSRINGHIRRNDVFGRLGGDEFVILLNEIGADEVRRVVDAIVKAVRHGHYVRDKISEEKSISLGVLCVPAERNHYDLETLIDEADALMYMAKRSGAGRIRMRMFTAATVG